MHKFNKVEIFWLLFYLFYVIFFCLKIVQLRQDKNKICLLEKKKKKKHLKPVKVIRKRIYFGSASTKVQSARETLNFHFYVAYVILILL